MTTYKVRLGWPRDHASLRAQWEAIERVGGQFDPADKRWAVTSEASPLDDPRIRRLVEFYGAQLERVNG